MSDFAKTKKPKPAVIDKKIVILTGAIEEGDDPQMMPYANNWRLSPSI